MIAYENSIHDHHAHICIFAICEYSSIMYTHSVNTHMCTQQWQGQGSTFHLLHTLLSFCQLGQTLGYI